MLLNYRLLLLLSFTLFQNFAHAHFQMVYTPELLSPKGGNIILKLPFMHLGSDMRGMSTDMPDSFYQVTPTEENNLKKSLMPIDWETTKNTAKAYEATAVQKTVGDYVYVLVQHPWYDKQADIYLQQFAKLITNVGDVPTHWQKPLSLPIEIVPLQTPYKVYAGDIFSGVVMSHGKPLSNVSVEVQYLNYLPDMEKNAVLAKPLDQYPPDYFAALSLRTDAQGVFTVEIPKAGFWAFAAVEDKPSKGYKNKPLIQEAVIWVQAINKKEEKKMENVNEILEKIYKVSAYREYENKTEFEEGYSSVYGEITQMATNAIVDEFKDYFNENTVFYDLGSGLGKMVTHIGLQYNPKKACGIELSKERIKGANDIKEKYCKEMDNISYINESFFNSDLSDATVVYFDNVMYWRETKKIIDLLPEGCLFIFRIGWSDDEVEYKALTGKKFATSYGHSTISYLIK